jgi:hypothetical protein
MAGEPSIESRAERTRSRRMGEILRMERDARVRGSGLQRQPRARYYH